jgi:hypothetical protein
MSKTEQIVWAVIAVIVAIFLINYFVPVSWKWLADLAVGIAAILFTLKMGGIFLP